VLVPSFMPLTVLISRRWPTVTSGDAAEMVVREESSHIGRGTART
jgi:hypothetical protein